jgi:Glycosyl hydrolase family 26
MQADHARHRYAGPSHRAQPNDRPKRGRTLLMSTAVAIAAVSSLAVSASAYSSSAPTTTRSTATHRIYFGVVGDQSKARANASTTVGHHEYGQVAGNVPVGRMITMGTSGQSYNAIAAARPGSTTYNNIARWADTIRSRGGTILVAFAHEPEASKHSQFGGASSFIAAYRHVVDVFRARGANNVQFVWQMTDYAFALSSSSSQQAIKWYPGDGYVDAIGPDAYNWYSCGPGHGRWRDLSIPAAPALAFARAHGKQMVLAEFGSQAGPLRAQWLNNAHQWMIANQSSIMAAFYFDRPATVANTGCVFPLSSNADVTALANIVDDTAHFTG